jgi:hypothetical protein
MGKSKRGILTLSEKQRLDIIKAYPLAQVCEMLNGYLSGEISIRSDPKRSALSKNRLCVSGEQVSKPNAKEQR